MIGCFFGGEGTRGLLGRGLSLPSAGPDAARSGDSLRDFFTLVSVNSICSTGRLFRKSRSALFSEEDCFAESFEGGVGVENILGYFKLLGWFMLAL
jgi:hypothetical protein